MQRDSIANTFVVAICLCVVCSVVVSTAAVVLKPYQDANRLAERQRNILMAAGRYDPDEPLEESFKAIDTWVVELATGEVVTDTSVIDPKTYDQKAAAKDPEMSIALPPDENQAGIGRREKYSFVYVVKSGEGQVEQYILPVYGKGLWSTLYGFMALDADLRTIRGITFYQHGETPGLGGEIDNPDWKQNWVGKTAFDEQGDVRIQVIRGNVNGSNPNSEYQIDGLAGATITSNGVTNLVQFWLGENGFGPFLDRCKSGEL